MHDFKKKKKKNLDSIETYDSIKSDLLQQIRDEYNNTQLWKLIMNVNIKELLEKIFTLFDTKKQWKFLLFFICQASSIRTGWEKVIV